MSMTSRDVLFLLRARDYASREVRSLGMAFGKLGQQLESIDKTLATNVNRSLERQSRLIAENKNQLKSYNKVMDERIQQSKDKEQAALSNTSRAYREHARALANNAYLTKLAKKSQADYARTIRESNADITKGATQARRAEENRLARDIDGNREHIRALETRNRAISAMRASMAGNNAETAKALDFARRETALYRARSTGTEKFTRGLSAQAAAQVRANSASHQAYLQARRAEEALRKGKITQAQYVKARAAAWRAEQALNRKTIGDIDKEIARRKELSAQQKRDISEVADRRKKANEDQVRASYKANQARIQQLEKEKAAEVARYQSHQEQVKAAGARERETLKRTRDAYGENSRTHQEALKKTGEAERRAFERSAEQQRQSIQLYQRKIAMLQSAGIAATIAGTIMIAFGRKGVRALQSMTMESIAFRREVAGALTQIQTDTPASIDSLTRIARTIGTRIPAAMDTMGSTLFFIFSSLRVNTAQATQLLEGFAKEAVAGNTSIESAARSTIAIMNGMAMGVEDLTRIQDFQFQTVRRGVITYEQLSANIGKLIPSLRRAGQEIETGGAMLAFLTRQGLSAEMATTAAARSLELLADPRVVARLKDMRIEVENSAGEFLPLVDILSQLHEKWGHLAAPQRAQEMLNLFGGAGYRIQARRFLDTVIANFDHFLWQMDEAQNSAGAMEAALAIVFDEPQTQIQLMQNKLLVLRQEMGDNFIPIVMTLVDIGSGLIDWFRELDEGTKTSIANFIGFGSASLVIVGSITAIIGILSTLVALVSVATASIPAAIGIVLGLPAALTAAVAGMMYFTINSDDVTTAMEGMATALGISDEALGIITNTLGIAAGAAIVYQAGMLVANGAIGVMIGNLKKFVLAHPALTGFLVLVGAITTAIYFMGKESRLVQGYARDMGRAMEDSIPALIESESAIENYSGVMAEAARATIEQTLAEEGLIDVMRDSPYLNSADYVNGILNVNGAYESQLGILRDLHAQYSQEIDQEITGSWYLDLTNSDLSALMQSRREIETLIETYEHMGEAVQIAMRRTVAGWRELGGLEGLIGDYIYYAELAAEAEAGLSGGRGTYTSNEAELLAEIAAIINLTGALSSLSPEMQAIIRDHEDLGPVVESAMAYFDAYSQLIRDTLSPAWEMLGGILTSVSDIYRTKLGEMNEAAREAAEEQGNSYEEIVADIGLYGEALDEVTAELEWAMGAQQEIYDMHGQEVRAWWAQMYMDEPELARALYDELLAGNTAFFEQMRANRNAMMDFIISDFEHYGIDLVDLNGEINQDLIDDLSSTLGRSPAIIEAILSEHPAIMREQWAIAGDAMETGASEANERAAAQLGPTETVNTMGDSWSRAWVRAAKGVLDNATLAPPRVAAPRIPQATYNSAGYITGFRGQNRGGLVPGRGPDRDTVPTMLTRGEFVLRRSAVDALGVDTLEALNALNAGGLVQRNAGVIIGHGVAASIGSQSPGPQIPGPGSPGGIPGDLISWMPRFLEKYEQVIGTATDINIQATNDLMSAISAMRTHVEAQHGLDRARREVENLAQSIYDLTLEAREAELAIYSAWDAAAQITAQEEKVIIQAEINLQDAERKLESFTNGTWRAAAELNVLQSQQSVNSAQSNVNEFTNGTWARNQELAMIAAAKSIRDLESALNSFDNGTWERNQQLAIATAERNVQAALQTYNDLAAGVNKLNQELEEIAAKRSVREAQRRYEDLTNGVWELNQELDILRQQERIRQLEDSLKEMANVDYGNIADLEIAAGEAQARYMLAKAEMDRVQKIAPHMQDEVEALLLQFKAQNELNDSMKALQDAESALSEAHSETGASADELRIAEIELELARQQLIRSQEDMSYGSEELRVAQIELELAQQNLTETQNVAVTSTNDLTIAQLELENAQQALIDTQAQGALASEEMRVIQLELDNAYQVMIDTQNQARNETDLLAIAELELFLAEQNLITSHQDLNSESQELRLAQLDVLLAQEELTEAWDTAVGATDEVREAQENLDRIQQELTESTNLLDEAVVSVSLAELDATAATLGLIGAGQNLVAHGPDQFNFFSQLAILAGAAESNVLALISALQSLAGSSADYQGAINAHTGYDRIALEGGIEDTMARIKAIFDNRRVRIATDDETETQRLTRIAHEVMSGRRSMDQVRSSVDRLKSLNIGTYDNGGVLRPGWTLAYNGTGQNEFITRQNSMGGGLNIERGGITVNVEGDSTGATKQQIEQAISKLLEDLYDQMRSQ